MVNKKDQKVEKSLPEHTQRVKNDWDKKRNGGDIVVASDPASGITIVITRLEVDGNKVSVWTSDYEGVEPEYVIVNPPTMYPTKDKTYVEDPMTALAVSIAGAKR